MPKDAFCPSAGPQPIANITTKRETRSLIQSPPQTLSKVHHANFFRLKFHYPQEHEIKPGRLPATIAIPALTISGIYGMNLKGLPFQESPDGAEWVGGITILATALLLYILRKLKWL